MQTASSKIGDEAQPRPETAGSKVGNESEID
jgi:hypothetical protein